MRESCFSGEMFPFNEKQMEMLRSGSPEAENIVVTAAFSFFDRFVRAVRHGTHGGFNEFDAEDIVIEFFEVRFRRVVTLYKFRPAGLFNKMFNASLRNFARDWLDKKMRRESRIEGSQDEPVGDGLHTRGDFIGDPHPLPDCLDREEKRVFENNVLECIAKWTDDPVRRWIVETWLFDGLGPKEISELLPSKFPGKVYRPDSVSSVLTRFKYQSGIRAILNNRFQSTRGKR